MPFMLLILYARYKLLHSFIDFMGTESFWFTLSSMTAFKLFFFLLFTLSLDSLKSLSRIINVKASNFQANCFLTRLKQKQGIFLGPEIRKLLKDVGIQKTTEELNCRAKIKLKGPGPPRSILLLKAHLNWRPLKYYCRGPFKLIGKN